LTLTGDVFSITGIRSHRQEPVVRKVPAPGERASARPRAYPCLATAWDRLAAYLGDQFDPALTDFEALRRFLDQEWARLGSRFYESSLGYLYDLTFFHYMDAKDAFFQLVTRFAEANRITRIADVGCGIALDAQALIHAGYEVDGYDLENPSLAYARWRLCHDLPGRNRVQPITQLPGRRYPLAYAVDVIGHASDPLALIELMLRSADHVAINLPPHDPRHRYGPADLHPSLDHSRILPIVQQQAVLIAVAPCGHGVVTLWRSSHR
jgi:SAM-dependent methyltransferase